MAWLIGEAVTLAGLAYFFLQILMAVRYRGRWRLAALMPLVVIVPLAIHAGIAYAAGSGAWPLLLVLASPIAFAYLLIVAIAKGSAGFLKARRRPQGPG